MLRYILQGVKEELTILINGGYGTPDGNCGRFYSGIFRSNRIMSSLELKVDLTPIHLRFLSISNKSTAMQVLHHQPDRTVFLHDFNMLVMRA